MRRVVLLTGATGFLGTQIARRLLLQTDVGILALVKAEDRDHAARRIRRVWWDWPELIEALDGRVQIIRGDVTEPRLGLSDADYAEAVGQTTHIIHAAADLRLNAPIAELRRTNVQGVANVLELARAVHTDHGLARLAHISTAYVCGLRSGVVSEETLSHDFGFGSEYERSKYEGELLVRAAKAKLPVSIFRPGMIVGDSRTGIVKTFNTFYFPLRLYLQGRLWVLPVDKSLRVNIVPVDYVADAVARLTFDPAAVGTTLHLTAPEEALPTVEELIPSVRNWARRHLNLRLPSPLFVPPLPLGHRPSWLRLGRVDAELDELLALRPYYMGRKRFSRDNTDRLLGPYELRWRDFLPRLLEYAVSRGFMHWSGRTVHEQILFRLKSKSRPVTYRDITEHETVARRAEEVRADMLAAAGALRSLGVRPGDRVAVVGLNSTRYLTVDVAIGLVGAVSVPLYYTSPPAELDSLIAASGACLLMVDAPALLARVGELSTDIPIVSFCSGPLPAGLARPVASWREFLSRGAGSGTVPDVGVGLGDCATIRFTSGTTGRPKGAVFSHYQLRWMGITVASLMPWRTRTHPATYLSFLPMNHVVEGILATYSAYYVPAPIQIDFLEDIRLLQRVLPRVRPMIFFSVPRMYEKIWEALISSWIGRFYIDLPPGLLKRALRPVLRRSILRRAGLGRCAQLIVGSAPASETLLRAFHELEIEIHNAYGQTEAPLVTMNRAGVNRIGTVGQPLPQTELRLAEDGELLVRGPQVTAGYFDRDVASPVKDGWLRTGDVGHLSAGGYLVLEGRKKEFIATSYGKKVFPAKVESLLRSISGVEEAMVAGDGRPYCVALLWVRHPDEGRMMDIDDAVRRVNARLSHPEQVKRWAILEHDLSIATGDLTAKLDLRRTVVAQRYQRVIDGLYANESGTEGVLHRGGIDEYGGRPAMPSRSIARRIKKGFFTLLDLYAPTFIKRRALEELFSRTAAAFESTVPKARGRSYDERLRQYALFTCAQVEDVSRRGGDMNAIQDRLYERALRMGVALRKLFRVTDLDEATALSRTLYHMIGIDFRGTPDGEVVINRCYFSRFYTAEVCRVISSLDAGILAGLSGGAQLQFYQRLTEGSDRCRACLLWKERVP